jgi:hypothetical protein
MRPALDEPVALQGEEVVVDRARRRQADGIGDLAHRGRIPALLDSAGDALEDAPPALHIMPGHTLPPVMVAGA